MSDALRIPSLCVITDRRRLAPHARTLSEELTALDRFVDEAIDADVDLLQLRERDLDARTLAGIATRAVGRSAGRLTRILVNDRADVALAAGAHGVHLPGYGAPASEVRSLIRTGWTIGRSVHSIDEAKAERQLDYLLYGTVFDSRSKPAGFAQGLAGLERVVAAATMPVLAIGGITPARARACVQAGAAGIAGIGVFLPDGHEPGALGLARAVAELRAALIM